MKNYVQPGAAVEIVGPTGGVSSGDPVLIRGLFCVAADDIEDGADGIGLRLGAVRLPKEAPLVIDQWDVLYYDAGAGELTKTVSGNYKVGLANAAAASADTEVELLMTGEATIVEP